MEPEVLSFRQKFVAALTVAGFAYMVFIFVAPYSVGLNILSVVFGLLLASGYYVLMKTKMTLPNESHERWRFAMVCWILIAVIQALPLFSSAT